MTVELLRTASFALPIAILVFLIIMVGAVLTDKSGRSNLILLLISLMLFSLQYYVFVMLNAEKILIHEFPIDSGLFYIAIAPVFVAITLISYGLLSRFGVHTSLYIITVTLTWIGLIMIFRLCPDLKLEYYYTLSFKTSVFVSIGLISVPALVCLLRRKAEWLVLRRTTYFWLITGLALIFFTYLIVGQSGRNIWVRFSSFSIQPIEFSKLMYLLFLAGYIDRFGDAMNSVSKTTLSIKEYFRFAIPLLAGWFLLSAILFLQKDMGPAIVIFIVTFMTIIIVAPRPEITVLVSVGLVALFIAAYHLGGVDYQGTLPSVIESALVKFRTRVDSFFYPYQYSEQISRSLWAVAAGGFSGTGIGLSDCFRIPVAQSDFIFAAIANEMGMFTAAAIAVGYLALLIYGLKVAMRATDVYVKVLCAGLSIMTFCSAALIMAANLCIWPLTGINLPYISSGGSSYIAQSMMTAILLYLSSKEEGETNDTIS